MSLGSGDFSPDGLVGMGEVADRQNSEGEQNGERKAENFSLWEFGKAGENFTGCPKVQAVWLQWAKKCWVPKAQVGRYLPSSRTLQTLELKHSAPKHKTSFLLPKPPVRGQLLRVAQGAI